MVNGALSGIKVLDLSRVLAGPSCTQQLADLGAEVIKIERPEVGDETRQWAPPCFQDGTSAYFATVNRNKKSVTVNLSTAEGQDIIKRLAQEADVLIENYKVGGLKKYGLDYDSLKDLNPRLVYCSLTGYGQTGPDAHKPGYDYIIQGLSGLMSITGPSDGMPHKVGVAVVDLFTGLQATVGIQAALIAREKTGRGQYVDIALLDSAIAMLGNVGMNHLATNEVPPRLGNHHPNIVPYQVFETAQEQFLILACGNDTQFKKVTQIMGHPEWAETLNFATNPDRVENREELTRLMTPVFLTKERDEWIQLFEQVQVPCGPINNIAEAVKLPQVVERGMIIDNFEKHDDLRALGCPIKLSETPVSYHSAPPALGEHTEEILGAMGMTEAQIAMLKNNKVI